MQDPGDRITLSDIAHFSSLTGERMMEWEVTAIAEMSETFRDASKEGPKPEPLSMEAFDAFFNPGLVKDG